MLKDSYVKLRAATKTVDRWKGAAKDRQQTLTEFVAASVEAAIAGRVDQASLDRQLRSIRADSNAAHEAPSIEEARGHIDLLRQKIAELRGNFE